MLGELESVGPNLRSHKLLARQETLIGRTKAVINLTIPVTHMLLHWYISV